MAAMAEEVTCYQCSVCDYKTPDLAVLLTHPCSTITVSDESQVMYPASGPAFSSIDQPSTSTSCTNTKLEKWEDKQVRLLIASYLKHKNLLGKAGYTKKKLFDRIADEFNSTSDVFVTGDQCLRKWKKLESKQKEIEDNNSKTGRERKTWKFHKEMEECIGGSPSVKPIFTFETSSSSSRSTTPNLSHTDPDSDSALSDDCEESGCNSRKRPQRKRKSRSSAAEMIDLLKEYGDKREKIEEKKLTVLKEMQEEKKEFFGQLFSYLKDCKK